MTDAHAIELRGLTRRFGARVAVDDVSLTIPRGCSFGFLGPNGAGKSTTVRMLTGLLAPDSGDALIGGRSIRTDALAVKREVGVVPDNLALFERLSLWEHLTMIGCVFGLAKDETARRAEDLLRLLDLWDDRGTYAVDASHGMRKKLALAIALIHNPKTLFLDEPFEGIDPIAGKQIRLLLATLARRGVTIFMTSHILEIVERLADRYAIIAKGRIVAQGTLEEMRASGRSLDDLFAESVGARDAEPPELSWLTS